jgi:hypothetical protein
MKHLTYEAYLANPAIAEQIERQARQARAELVYASLAGMIQKLFRRNAAPQLQSA